MTKEAIKISPMLEMELKTRFLYSRLELSAKQKEILKQLVSMGFGLKGSLFILAQKPGSEQTLGNVLK